MNLEQLRRNTQKLLEVCEEIDKIKCGHWITCDCWACMSYKEVLEAFIRLRTVRERLSKLDPWRVTVCKDGIEVWDNAAR